MFQQMALHYERAQEAPKQTVASDFRFLSVSGQVEVCIRNTRAIRIIIIIVMRIITYVSVILFHFSDVL